MIRTSFSHPLQIATVSLPNAGRIGITFCPGKWDENAMTGAWRRDLAVDLDAIKRWGAAALVTLLEPWELTELRVERLGEEVERRGLRWIHLPIADGSIPDAVFERNWLLAGEDVKSLLKDGKAVVVHCRGGLGRAGTIAARLLVELGTAPAEAIRKVRAARPDAIENSDQEQHILDLRNGR